MRPVLHAVQVDEVIEVIRTSIGDSLRAVAMGTGDGDRLCNEWQINADPDVTTQSQNPMDNQRWANNYKPVMMRMGPLQQSTVQFNGCGVVICRPLCGSSCLYVRDYQLHRTEY